MIICSISDLVIWFPGTFPRALEDTALFVNGKYGFSKQDLDGNS